jgi:hypothetical protein
MNYANIDTRNTVFRTLREMNTSWQHTHFLPPYTEQNDYMKYSERLHTAQRKVINTTKKSVTSQLHS